MAECPGRQRLSGRALPSAPDGPPAAARRDGSLGRWRPDRCRRSPKRPPVRSRSRTPIADWPRRCRATRSTTRRAATSARRWRRHRGRQAGGRQDPDGAEQIDMAEAALGAELEEMVAWIDDGAHVAAGTGASRTAACPRAERHRRGASAGWPSSPRSPASPRWIPRAGSASTRRTSRARRWRPSAGRIPMETEPDAAMPFAATRSPSSMRSPRTG